MTIKFKNTIINTDHIVRTGTDEGHSDFKLDLHLSNSQNLMIRCSNEKEALDMESKVWEAHITKKPVEFLKYTVEKLDEHKRTFTGYC